MSSTVVVAADWIKRIADDERRRDTARLREDEIAARKADLVRRNGQRLIDDLRAAVTRDVDAFCGEFVGDPARQIFVDATAPDDGFVVHNGMPPREDRVDVLFVDNATDELLMKHRVTGQVFGTADALSEFLLVPV